MALVTLLSFSALALCAGCFILLGSAPFYKQVCQNISLISFKFTLDCPSDSGTEELSWQILRTQSDKYNVVTITDSFNGRGHGEEARCSFKFQQTSPRSLTSPLCTRWCPPNFIFKWCVAQVLIFILPRDNWKLDIVIQFFFTRKEKKKLLT